jgi:sulfur carrier protein
VTYFLNGERREHDGTLRLSDVVGDIGRGIAVAVDGVVIPRTRHAETEVGEGARVEIVTAVQGG